MSADSVRHWEHAIALAMRRHWRRQRRVFLEKLRGPQGTRGTKHWVHKDGTHGTKAINPFNLVDRERWRLDLVEDIAELLVAAIRDILTLTGLTLAPEVVEDITRPWLVDLTERQNKFLDKLIERVRAEDARPDSTMDDIVAVADEMFDKMVSQSESQATQVAYGSSNAAQLAAAKESGVVSTKRWYSSLDDRVRPTHAAAHNQSVPVQDPFRVGNAFLQYPSDPTGPPEEVINCFPGETLVQAEDVELVYRRWYEGPLVRVQTAGGRELSGTPNHPVATSRGWVAMGALVKGDDLVCSTSSEEVSVRDPHVGDVPATIGEVFSAATEARDVHRLVVSDRDFHGDGLDGEVDVVRVDGVLRNDRQPSLLEHQLQDVLPAAYAGGESRKSHGSSSRRDRLRTVPLATPGRVGGGDQASALLGGRLSHPSDHALAPVPGSDSGLQENAPDWRPADAEDFSQMLLGLSGEVSLDEIVAVDTVDFANHVYNLQTKSGYYRANTIVAHNCRCVMLFETEFSNLPAPLGEVVEQVKRLTAELSREVKEWAARPEPELAPTVSESTATCLSDTDLLDEMERQFDLESRLIETKHGRPGEPGYHLLHPNRRRGTSSSTAAPDVDKLVAVPSQPASVRVDSEFERPPASSSQGSSKGSKQRRERLEKATARILAALPESRLTATGRAPVRLTLTSDLSPEVVEGIADGVEQMLRQHPQLASSINEIKVSTGLKKATYANWTYGSRTLRLNSRWLKRSKRTGRIRLEDAMDANAALTQGFDALAAGKPSAWHPKHGAGRGVAAVVEHELGHAATGQAVGDSMDEFIDEYVSILKRHGVDAVDVGGATERVKRVRFKDSDSRLELEHQISQYASTNFYEAIAEAHAQVAENGPDASPLSLEIVAMTRRRGVAWQEKVRVAQANYEEERKRKAANHGLRKLEAKGFHIGSRVQVGDRKGFVQGAGADGHVSVLFDGDKVGQGVQADDVEPITPSPRVMDLRNRLVRGEITPQDADAELRQSKFFLEEQAERDDLRSMLEDDDRKDLADQLFAASLRTTPMEELARDVRLGRFTVRAAVLGTGGRPALTRVQAAELARTLRRRPDLELTAREVEALAEQLPEDERPARPPGLPDSSESVTLYRGERTTEDLPPGSLFTDRPAYAQNFAGDSGRILRVEVPEDVAARAAAEARTNGDVGFDLPYEWADRAQVLTSASEGRPAELTDAQRRALRKTKDPTVKEALRSTRPLTTGQRSAVNAALARRGLPPLDPAPAPVDVVTGGGEKIEPDAPLPETEERHKPMKFESAHLVDVPRYVADPAVFFQQKVDGIRGQLVIRPGERPWFRSGGGEVLKSDTAAKITKPLLARLETQPGAGRAYVVDGELLDEKFHVFDLVVDGEERTPWEQRVAAAEEWVRILGDLAVHALPVARTAAEKQALHDAVLASGGEGIMIKRRDAPYTQGRRVTHTLKAKFRSTAEVVVIDVNRGGHENVVLGVYVRGKLQEIGHASAIGKPKAKPGDVIEVSYLYVGKPLERGGSLVQPNFLRLRPDKTHADATDRQLRFVNKAVLDASVMTPGFERLPAAERIRRAVTTGVVSQERLHGGSSADVFRVTYSDGTQVVQKTPKGVQRLVLPGDVEAADAEEIVGHVAELLGFRDAGVVRVTETTTAALFVEGRPGAALRPDEKAEVYGSPQASKVTLLDLLVDNFDRNTGNWIKRPDGSIAVIDHGLAFKFSHVSPLTTVGDSAPPDDDAARAAITALGPRFGQNFAGVHPDDVDSLRTRLEALRGEFERLGRVEWHERMMRRFERILELFDGETAQRLIESGDGA